MDCLWHAVSGDVVDVSTHASAAPVPPVEMLPKDVAADGTVAEAAPEIAEARRLWLHASLASSPGAFGFFRTAHAEPLGDNLRILLNYDLPGTVPPATGVTQELLGGWYCWSLLHPDNLGPYSYFVKGVTTLLKFLALPILLPPCQFLGELSVTLCRSLHVTAITHGHADVDRMLDRAEPLDLTLNVFHNGVWGTLRHEPLVPPD